MFQDKLRNFLSNVKQGAQNFFQPQPAAPSPLSRPQPQQVSPTFGQRLTNAIGDFVQQTSIFADPAKPGFWQGPVAQGLGNLQRVGQTAGKVVNYAVNPAYQSGNQLQSMAFPEGPKIFRQLSTPQGQAKFNQEPAPTFIGNLRQYVGNRYVAPIAQVPYNVGQVFGKDKTLLERGMGALGVAGGTLAMIPDPIGDIAMPAYDYFKGVSAAQKQGQGIESFKTGIKSLTGQQYTGLGTASGAKGNTEGALNLAELPLVLFMGGRLAKNKNLDEAVKRSQPIISSTVLAIEQYDKFVPADQMKLFKQTEDLAKQFIPQVLNNASMKKMATFDPTGWIKQMGTFLENRVAVANNPQINIGLNTQGIKRPITQPSGAGGVDTRLYDTGKPFFRGATANEWESIKNGGSMEHLTKGRTFVSNTLNDAQGIVDAHVRSGKTGNVIFKSQGGVPAKDFNPQVASENIKSLSQKTNLGDFVKSNKGDPNAFAYIEDLNPKMAQANGVPTKTVTSGYAIFHIEQKRPQVFNEIMKLLPDGVKNPDDVFPNPNNPNGFIIYKQGTKDFAIVASVDRVGNYNFVRTAYDISGKNLKNLQSGRPGIPSSIPLQARQSPGNIVSDVQATTDTITQRNNLAQELADFLDGKIKDTMNPKVMSYNGPEGGMGGVSQVAKPKVELISPQTGLPELGTQKISLQPRTESGVPSTSIIPVYKRLELAQDLLNNKSNESLAAAELAKNARGQLSPDIIKDVNLLKRVSKGQKFQVGDVETFRREYPQVTERVIQAVRENPQYENLSDSEALQVALELPTQQMTKIKRSDTSTVNILTREQKLETKVWEKEFGKQATLRNQDQAFKEWDSAVNEYASGIKRTPGATSVEPSLKTKIQLKDKAVKPNLQESEYKTWQKQIYGESETRTTSKAISDLAKSVKSSTNQGILNNADNWKNKPKLSFTRETMERNFEDIMGSDAPVMKKKLLEPIYKSEAERIKFLNKERADIKSLGIKARSKDSAILQDYGEGKLTIEDVRKQSSNPDKIITAERVLRQKYDTYLTQLNAVLTRNGYNPIPKRADYFHHFQDLNGIFEQVGVSIKATDLPTDINGLTADFKPGKTFFSAALHRRGPQTSVDAITGIDKYLEGASNQIYHTDNIQALRAFEKAIREKYAGTDHLSNFVADLGEYTNKLAGKKSMIDRAAEAVVGRRIYAGATTLKRQTGANMVGANISSALTNFIPLTETLATTDKVSVSQAMLGIIKNVFKDDGFVDSSNFLTSRLGSDRLSMTNWQKIGQGGNWMFKTIDNFTSQLAVRSKYLEGLKKGLSEESAMSAADAWGRKTIGGRSAGEMPTLFQSQTLGFLTQFQLEVNNQMSFIAKDIPRNFSKVGAASALAQLFLYSYIYNNIYEKITGRRPAIDPIGLAQRTYEDYTNPNMKRGQALKNLTLNTANQLPFASTFTGGRIPIGGAIPDPFAVMRGDSTIGKELKKPLYYLLAPTGGGQVKKLVEGVGAYKQGASTTDAGNVRYPIPQTGGNLVKTALFGQYSTPEAQTYFRDGRNVLGKDQSEIYKNLPNTDQTNYYDNIITNRQASNKEDDLIKQAKSGGITDTTKLDNDLQIKVAKAKLEMQPDGSLQQIGKIVLYKENGAVKNIDLSFPLKEYTPTGDENLDKELLADYKGSITTAKNNVIKAWQVGAITQEEAAVQIEKLNAASDKTKKAKELKTPTAKGLKTSKSTKLAGLKFKTSSPLKKTAFRMKLPQAPVIKPLTFKKSSKLANLKGPNAHKLKVIYA